MSTRTPPSTAETAERDDLHRRLDALLPPYHHPRLNTQVKRFPRRSLSRRQWPAGVDGSQMRSLALALTEQEALIGHWPPLPLR